MTVKIKYIGHSGFVITSDDYSILIDPFITGNPEAKINIKEFNIDNILVTHAHADHLGDSIDIAKQKNISITAVFELANYCSKKGAKAQGVNIGGKIDFDWGYARWLTAAHSSSTPDGHYAGCPSSILINMDGVSIYHAGDTGLHSDIKMTGELYKPEISLLPIGGCYTMDIEEAVQAAKWLQSKKVIPMHYNTFPPIQVKVEEFKRKIESETDSKCIVLKPGEKYINL